MTDWDGAGIALEARRFGENDAVLDLFTADRGRLAGLVYGGSGRRKRALLEPGTQLSAAWRARAEEALGFFDTLEPAGFSPASVMDDAAALAALSSLTRLLADTLPERVAFPALHEATAILLGALAGDAGWPALVVRWEAGLLAELGYGLDLSACALTGAREDLAWVSPRTGRAASREAGAPYAHNLLALPGFLLGSQQALTGGDVADGLALTGHFLARDVLEPLRRDLPDARGRMIIALGRSGRL